MFERATPSTFATRLAELCDERRIPVYGRQSKLARALKVSQNAVRKWLVGESQASRRMCQRLAALFAVNVAWLEHGEGPKYQATAEGEPKEQTLRDIYRCAEEMSPYERTITLAAMRGIKNGARAALPPPGKGRPRKKG